MKLQKGKWYVCIDAWSDDGWTKFADGDLVRCEHDDELTDCYGITHLFLEDDMPQLNFREATETESNIASATDVSIDEFVEGISYFEPETTLKEIYRAGADRMLKLIKAQLSIKG